LLVFQHWKMQRRHLPGLSGSGEVKFSLPYLAARADQDKFHIRWLAGTPERVSGAKPHSFKVVWPIVRIEQHNELCHAVLGAHRAQEIRIVAIRKPVVTENNVDRMAHQHFPSLFNGWTGAGIDWQPFHNLQQRPFCFDTAGDNE
jgi:hypothetical protein